MKKPIAEKLPSGAWSCRVYSNGITKRFTGDDKNLVEAEALAFKLGIIKDEKHPEKKTLEKVITEYIESKSAILSPATLRGYDIIQRNRFQAYKNISVDKLTPRKLQQMVNDEARLCSAKTLKNAWGLIASALRAASVDTEGIMLPMVKPTEKLFLDYEQIQTFLKAIEGNEKIELPALLALHSLRRSELCALKWDSIDTKKETIRVSGAKVPGRDHKYVVKAENKNVSSTRIIPIFNDRLIELVNTAKNDPEKDTSGYVVECNPNTLNSRINAVCEAAGLPQVGVHGLRHSYASLCHYIGIPEMECAKIGGWNDLTTMHKIYTHLSEAGLNETKNKLKNAFKMG